MMMGRGGWCRGRRRFVAFILVFVIGIVIITYYYWIVIVVVVISL